MRRMMFVLTALLALAAAPPVSAATVTVAINRAGFTPNPAQIEVGDTVTWTNSDTRNRQVISRAASFASPILKPGETFSFTFKTAGRFSYEEALVEPTRRGTVVVNAASTPPPPPAPAGTITLAASSSIAVFGGSVRLGGELSSGLANETVEVLAVPFGSTTASAGTKVTEAKTTAGGEFAVSVKPTIQTVYRVRSGQIMSGRVTIRVRPRIGFGIVSVSRGIFTARAMSSRSYAGRVVFLQRRNGLGQWVSIKRVRLGSASAARFQAKLPRGLSRVRVYMTPAQAGPGYMAGMSAVRIVRR
jgi:plastocyanin